MKDIYVITESGNGVNAKTLSEIEDAIRTQYNETDDFNLHMGNAYSYPEICAKIIDRHDSYTVDGYMAILGIEDKPTILSGMYVRLLAEKLKHTRAASTFEQAYSMVVWKQ